MNLQPVYFMVGFITLLLAFIAFIGFLSRRLSGAISRRTYSLVEMTIIGGIFLGIIGMFQPLTPVAYRVGFLVVLFSTLSFIVWSHITPRFEDREPITEEVAGLSVSEAVRENVEPILEERNGTA